MLHDLQSHSWTEALQSIPVEVDPDDEVPAVSDLVQAAEQTVSLSAAC